MAERAVPRVSITLATWNARRWLPGCLASIAAQTEQDYELVIIDDGSSDETPELLREAAAEDPRIRLELLERNVGYAVAHNRAIRATRADAVLLLNQDVELDPGYLAAALAALDAHPEAAAIQGRILRLGPELEHTDTVDTTGLCMHRDRRVVSRDQNRADGALDRPPGPVWGADGPAPLCRRAALLGARLPRRRGGWEILDEDFCWQKEDVDLAWRMRRLGWTAWYDPAAVAWHARGGADTSHVEFRDTLRANMANPLEVRRAAWRNQRLAQLKNDELRTVLSDLPWILRRELLMFGGMLLVDQRRLRAVLGLVRATPWALRKRRALMSAIRRGERPT